MVEVFEHALTVKALLAKDEPVVMPAVALVTLMLIAGNLIAEVALSFLGLGIQAPEASWNNLLSAVQNIRYLFGFPWLLRPGLGVFIVAWA